MSVKEGNGGRNLEQMMARELVRRGIDAERALEVAAEVIREFANSESRKPWRRYGSYAEWRSRAVERDWGG